MDCCDVATATLHEFEQIFRERYLNAVEELGRLEALFMNVAWYNFEVKCQRWQLPLHSLYDETIITLHGARITESVRRGVRREHGSFPIYYTGFVQHAPHLPPKILAEEVALAQELVDECEEQIAAQYEWAPYGSKYQDLMRNGESVRKYEQWRTNSKLQCGQCCAQE